MHVCSSMRGKEGQIFQIFMHMCSMDGPVCIPKAETMAWRWDVILDLKDSLIYLNTSMGVTSNADIVTKNKQRLGLT